MVTEQTQHHHQGQRHTRAGWGRRWGEVLVGVPLETWEEELGENNHHLCSEALFSGWGEKVITNYFDERKGERLRVTNEVSSDVTGRERFRGAGKETHVERRRRWLSEGSERAQRAAGRGDTLERASSWKEKVGGLRAAGRVGAESMCPGGKNTRAFTGARRADGKTGRPGPSQCEVQLR